MAITSTQVTLNTSSSTLLATGATGSVVAAYISVSAPAYIGPSGVTSATGLAIEPSDIPFRIPLGDTEVLHAIAAVTPNQQTVVVGVLKTST